MARPQEFETSEALHSAMRVFWLKGYEATTLADILAATNLSKSSLYATFGDKRELFLKAFQTYQKERIDRLEQILNNGQPARQSLESFFRMVIYINTAGAEPGCGCMTANEAVELAPHDADVQRMVADDFQAIENHFRQTIIRGKSEGSIRSNQASDILARFLVLNLQGLEVMLRAKTDRGWLDETIPVIMSVLD